MSVVKSRSKAALARRSDCPVACTLDLLGDRWTLLVVRDLFLGKQRFQEFLGSPEGIATNILADRLQRLEHDRMIDRIASESHEARATYRLTARGATLRSVMLAMLSWGLEQIPGTSTAAAGRPLPRGPA